MTDQELIQYYVNLLIVQYASMPNAAGTIAALISLLVSGQIFAAIGDGFNFAVSPIGATENSAIGVQLDQIAAYRGASRVIYGLAPNIYFDFADAENLSAATQNGFMDALVGPVPITWLFLTSEQTELPIYALTDDELYRLVQFMAQVSQSDMSIESIDTILYTFFGNNVAMLENGNMSVFYIDLTSDTDTLFGIVSVLGVFPRSAGVDIETFKADMITNFFGLQDALTGYNSGFVGFSDAETALTVGTFVQAP